MCEKVQGKTREVVPWICRICLLIGGLHDELRDNQGAFKLLSGFFPFSHRHEEAVVERCGALKFRPHNLSKFQPIPGLSRGTITLFLLLTTLKY